MATNNAALNRQVVKCKNITKIVSFIGQIELFYLIGRRHLFVYYGPPSIKIKCSKLFFFNHYFRFLHFHFDSFCPNDKIFLGTEARKQSES